MACVNITSKDFKDLANKYKVSNGTLELAINMYLDQNSLDDYNPNDSNFISYLNNYLKLGNTNTYSSQKDVDNAIKIWDKIKPRFEQDLSLEELKELSGIYGLLFGPENIIIYETNQGSHRIRVAKPVLESQNEKEGVSEVFENTPELAKISTQEQYSQYLDTIFPDSKVKDIVHHGSNQKFDEFKKNQKGRNLSGGRAFYFTTDIEKSENYSKNEDSEDINNIYHVLLDVKSPNSELVESGQIMTEEEIKSRKRQGYDGLLLEDEDSDYIEEYVVFEPEQIHILGSKQDIEGFKQFVENQDGSNSSQESSQDTSLLYQVVNNDFREILQKLHKINKTPLGVGSDKNIRHQLKKDGIPNGVIEGIISIINKNKQLRSVSFGNIFSSYIKLINKDSNDSYYKHIQKPINQKLEELILDYFKPYNITQQILDNLKDRFGVDSTGAYDILNKIVYISKNRNALTLPEEYGHVFVELLGSVPSKNLSKQEKNMSEIYSFLHGSVEDWSGYSRVFEDYKDIYTRPDGSPDINKIKKEAIGQAIGMALVEQFEASEGKSKSFFDKIFDAIKAVYDKFSNVDFIAFESQVNSIAKDIIEKNYSKLNKVKNTENYNLLDYNETIQNQNKIDGGKALSFMQYFSELGNIITGSLAYRKQGTVYRPKIDALHDIDMIVDQSTHGIDLSGLDVQALLRMDRSKGSSRDNILNFIKDQDYFKKVSEKYPKMKYVAGYGDNNRSRITVNAVYSENESLSERFSLLTGDYASRLDKFTEEERSQIYLFDFFLKSNGESTEYVKDEDYQLNLAHHNYSFAEKQNQMGRPKDAYDYQNWKAFNPLQNQVEELVSQNIMFQKKQETTPKGTINIYWGKAESETSTKILSNLAPRKFTWEGREYGSVEHAYQSNKSGTFDKATYDAYNNIGGYGKKIRGKGSVAEMKAADSLGLMKKLVVESFKQNSNSEAAKKLLQYENFTHNTNELIDKAFLEGLKLAQKELSDNNQETTPGLTISAFGRNVSIRDASNPYKKTDPSKNPDKAFVFTENAQAYAAYTPSMRSGDRILGSASPQTVKLKVNDMAGSATPNTAGIRSINGKTKQPNVFGIVVKKYQQLNGIDSRFVAKEGQFNDTDSDFMIFQAFNRDFFEKLQLSKKKEIVMPGSIALGRAALPLRFAEWLQKEINDRIGVNYSIAKTETAGYDGYGLKFNHETNAGSQSSTPQQKQQAQQSIVSATLAEQGTSVEIEIIGQSGKEFLLTVDRSGRIDLWSNKTEEGGYQQGEIASKEQIKTLYNKYVPIAVRDAIAVWQDAFTGSWANPRTKAGKNYTNTEKKLTQELKNSLASETPAQRVKETPTTKDTPSLEKSKAIVDKIINDSKKRIVFDEKTHTYTVDGKKADYSVTQWLKGDKKVDLGLWGLPSSLIGTTADVIVRDFFEGRLKSQYPNMSSDDLQGLKDDLKKLVLYFDSKFGKGKYGIVTQEFPIASMINTIDANGKPVKKLIAGTMDMLIYDDKGNFYIYDMKTARSGINDNKKSGYTKQLNAYKSILEASYPELKDKIKELSLIHMSVSYPNPNDSEVIYQQGDESLGEDPNQLYLNEYGIEDSEDYAAPRLDFDEDITQALISLSSFSFNDAFEALSEDDKRFIVEEVGDEKQVYTEFEDSPRNKQLNAVFDSNLIPAQERSFLANSVMTLTSVIISHLQEHKAANKKYFSDGRFEDIDFTTKTRREIIELIDINNLFNIVKEQYFNTENLDIDDESILAKLDLIYDNWNGLIRVGKNKLITLEDVTIDGRVFEENIDQDLGDPNIADENDSGNLEEKTREYWQIGQRQLSAKSNLSILIRRTFDRLPVLDENGNQVLDEYGYGLPLYVDSDVAVNSILKWVNTSRDIESMEEVLMDMSKSFPWINSVLAKIKEEPFRSQFYNNFRKDFTKYSVVNVDYDDNGNRTYVTHVVNTKGASKVILEEIVSAFREGVMSNLIKSPLNAVDGAGKVNEKEIIRLNKIRKQIYDDLIKAGKTSKAEFQKTLENSIPAITDLLVQLGIHTNEKTIKAALTKDLQRANYLQASNISSILLNTYHLLNTLNLNKEEVSYNPIAKGQEGNIYGNYKNIVNVLADYIQDNIESSTFENGKLYYSFTTPSYIQNMVNSLSDAVGNQAKFDNYLEDNYGSFKWFKTDDSWNNEWLRLLATDVKKRAQFEHKVQLSFESRKGNKVSYEKLSKLGYTTSMMTEFFYDKKKNYAWYRVPIMSDKPSAEFIKFVRYHTGYKDKISSGMKNVFDQELMRIKAVLERAVAIIEDDTRVEDIKFYDAHKVMKDNPILIAKLQSQRDTGKVTQKNRITIDDIVKNNQLVFSGTGAEFKFLPAFNNNIIAKDEIGLMIAEKLNINSSVNESKLAKLFDQQFKSYMADIFVSEKENWKKLGVYDTEVIKKNNKETTQLKYVPHLGKNEQELDSNLEEYLWNDMFATVNIIQLTTTDLAYYKNVEDFQKRFAQVHAPTMKMNISAIDRNGVRYSDGIERSMSIEDSEIVSNIIPQIKSVLYNKVGQGLMTKFHADSILAQYGYSNTSDGKFVKSKTEDGKEIFLKSSTINVTDGQGYSSPTSYRKKMGMMGKWSNQMEDAYEKIKSGNWNGEDLDVVWQPLKPFVYSQLRKTSYSDTMSELKVPMQFKNSEYLLVMADAILEGEGEVNNLSSIYKFMEDSAYTNGKYNGRGIDTVQFGSTVKTGLMGVVDINNAKSNQEIIDILKEAAYNEDGEYNDQVVHNISFDDYGIQQEVPAHLMGKQLMGSQMRILAISDMSADSTFDVAGEKLSSKELNLEYQNLIAENINDSFNQLVEELNLQGDKFEKNKALSNLLLDAIKNDTKYGPDMEYALTLKDGQFNIPLSDPIQSIKIQQLLNSIIKSRINKQTISGGPIVQVTAFSKDLRVIWKGKDGNILMNSEEWEALPKDQKTHNSFEKYLSENKASVAHYEVYMPIPSLSMEEALTKADGTLMSIEEALKAKVINEEQLKAIGYRIPTEDKYSLAPMKIKGFLPKSAGEGIMMPLEITLISGSDFDIDKLYIILKDFNASGEKTNYKALKNDLLKDNDIKELLKKDGVNVSKNKNISDALSVIFDQIEARYAFSEGSPEMYVYDYINNNKQKYVKHYFNEYNDLKRREGRNNRIFDLQWAVLTNEDTADKMFNPGSFDVQKKIARVVNIAKNPNNKYTYDQLSSMTLDQLNELVDQSSGKDILISSTQVYLHNQNMTAGALIGIFANNNTAHAFTAMQDIDVIVDDPFCFDGVTVNNGSNNKLDKLIANDNMTLISKTIAGYLAASVDAVKDPVLNFLNLNTFTTNVAMLLTRMGFDADSVGLFLTQPIIEKVTNEYFKRSNEGYTSIDSVINDELQFLKDKYSISPEVKDLESNKFTKEDMFKNIQMRARGDVNIKSIAYQAQALLLFQQLAEKGQHLNTLTFLTKFNSVSNAVGPTIADTLVMDQRYQKFLDLMTNPKAKHPFSENAIDIIENSPILKSFYNNTAGKNGASKLIFQDNFFYYTSTFELIMSRMKDSIKGNLDSKLINKLISEFMLYKITIANQGEFQDKPIFDTSPAQRTKYMNNFVKYFLDKTRDINDNDLINVISVKSKDKKNPASTLQAKTGGYSINTQEKIKDAWTNLINDPNTQEIGIELFFYNLMRSGFNFSPKTFLHLASSGVKMNIPGYIESLRDVEFNNQASNVDEFIIYFLRNHSEDARLVPKLKNEKLKIKRFKGIDRKNKYTFTYNPNSKELQDIRLDSDNEFSKFISFEDKLLMYESNINNTVTYSESSPLGNTNNFLEYNANEVASEMNSVLKSPVEFIVQEEEVGTPSNETVQDDNFSLSKSDERILEKILTAEQLSDLGILKGQAESNAIINMLQEKYDFETSERIKRQIKKIINKLC